MSAVAITGPVKRRRPDPLCPVDPAHGDLLSWRAGRWFCPHEDHGANGRFFDKPATR